MQKIQDCLHTPTGSNAIAQAGGGLGASLTLSTQKVTQQFPAAGIGPHEGLEGCRTCSREYCVGLGVRVLARGTASDSNFCSSFSFHPHLTASVEWM
jgi:hypothetical protein